MEECMDPEFLAMLLSLVVAIHLPQELLRKRKPGAGTLTYTCAPLRMSPEQWYVPMRCLY